MTQASAARNEKRAKKKVQHQTHSFAQLVSQAQLKALEPYIQAQVAEQFRQASQGIYQFVMSERSQMQTRQLAFERLLRANTTWFTDEVLALAVADVEDEALQLKAVDTGAKEGDKVRIELQVMAHDKTEWTPGNKLAIHSLNSKGPNGAVQTHEALEAAVVGMTVGETKEFLVPEPVNEGEEPEHTRVKVTVKRVSRGPEPVAATETPAVVEETKGE